MSNKADWKARKVKHALPAPERQAAMAIADDGPRPGRTLPLARWTLTRDGISLAEFSIILERGSLY